MASKTKLAATRPLQCVDATRDSHELRLRRADCARGDGGELLLLWRYTAYRQ